MREYPTSLDSSAAEDAYVQMLAEEFKNSGDSLKVRKIKLFQALGFPTPETDIFSSQELDQIEEKILERRGQNPQIPMLIRFGCIPDKLSMPSIMLEPHTDLDQALREVAEYLRKRAGIQDIILQELTPEAKAPDKISGRILIEKFDAYPREIVLELYKGARSTSVLNNADVSSPNFLRFEKELGHFMKPKQSLKSNSDIEEAELTDIFRTLQDFMGKIYLMKKIIARSREMSEEGFVCSFEFSYSNGRLVFSDVDY